MFENVTLLFFQKKAVTHNDIWKWDGFMYQKKGYRVL